MQNQISVLDLFSGITGISLGLEWTGRFRTIGFCEIDENCRSWIEQLWPGIPVFENVTTLTSQCVLERCGRPDAIVGGFPCQDVSIANAKSSDAEVGSRSGLWREAWRLIRELRPRWFLLENSPALKTRGFDAIADEVEREGYTITPLVVGAWAVGASHPRERVWVIGLDTTGCSRPSQSDGRQDSSPAGTSVHATGSSPINGTRDLVTGRTLVNETVADTSSEGLEGFRLGTSGTGEEESLSTCRRRPRVDYVGRPLEPPKPWEEPRLITDRAAIERYMGRPVDGVSKRIWTEVRIALIQAFGNAVQPQVVEQIGAVIAEADSHLKKL